MSKKTANNIQYTKDEFGKDILLKNNSLQVVMEWEKPYMEACIDAIQPKGDVLEIGFGLGYASSRIQHHHPKHHTIIESNPEIIAQAKQWAKKHPNVTIIEGTWQAELDKLGKFDAIFIDDYMPLNKDEIKHLQKDAAQGRELADEALSMRDAVSETLKQFHDVKFSDDELHSFIKQTLKKRGISINYIHNFVENLEKWGNITSQQKAKTLKELEKESKTRGNEDSSQLPWQQPKQFPADRFIVFAEACLDRHMKPGARLSGYMGNPESQKKHPEFQKRILSRKDLNYTEKTMPVSVPANCQFYDGNKALIVVIEKKV